MKYLLFLLFTFCFCLQGRAQSDSTSSEPIELISAGELEMMMEKTVEARYLRSSDTAKVTFKQGDAILKCKEAIHFPDSNFVVAFGAIEILRGDSIRLYGDTLLYYGNSRFAEMRHRVIFTDKHVLLTTSYIYYDLNKNLASYQFGGTVKDGPNTLKSRKGYYHTLSKMISFKGNVEMDNPTSDYHIRTDTLAYHTVDKIAFIRAKTAVKGRDGDLEVQNGEYYTQESRSFFRNGARMDTDEYTLSADSLDYDEVGETGLAKGHVRLFSKKDSITVYGNQGFYDGPSGFSSVTGQAIVQQPFGQDTLFMLADTLISVSDSANSLNYLIAYPHVRIFSKELEGICDSLFYQPSDSTISFYKDPVLWSKNSQMLADTMVAQLKNGAMDKLYLRQKAFIISKDTIGQFDQMKGRNMIAHFQDSKIRQVDVTGNGESLYFALEQDSILIGMNQVICSSMILRFTPESALKNITFIKNPEAKFIPPHEITPDLTKLSGFIWKEDERPKRAELESHPNRPKS
jgi:hypothetical protein